jgi:hypothetical protein
VAQEKSFLDALIMWHGEGIILLHRLAGAEDPGRSSGADEPRPSHRPAGAHDHALSSVDSLLEPEPGPKRRAVDGPDGPMPVCDPDGGLGGVSDGGGGGRGGGGHEGMLGGLRDPGDGGRLGIHDGLLGGGGRDGMDPGGMGMHEGVGGEGFKACMAAANNLNAHPHSYQITGWSVIRSPSISTSSSTADAPLPTRAAALVPAGPMCNYASRSPCALLCRINARSSGTAHPANALAVVASWVPDVWVLLQPAQVGLGEAALVYRRRHERVQAGTPLGNRA